MISSFAASLTGTLLLAVSPAIGHLQSVPATGTLHGRLGDEGGAVLRDAFVLVHGGPEQASHTLLLDRNGEFDIQLVPGVYDFFAGAKGFAPFAKAIRIEPGKPVILKVRMRVDKEQRAS